MKTADTEQIDLPENPFSAPRWWHLLPFACSGFLWLIYNELSRSSCRLTEFSRNHAPNVKTAGEPADLSMKMALQFASVQSR